MNISRKVDCAKRAVIAGFAIYATGEVWQGRDTFAEGFRRLEDAHAAGLNLGMQIIMLLLILYLCLLASKNIMEIVIICKRPEDGEFADDSGRRLMEIMEKTGIILGYAPALMIFIMFMAIAIYGMYMASVGRAGEEMYGVGMFFIIVAAWGIISILRKFIGILKGKQTTNE